jgi:leader peptidase (prepilin peptidase)/N-methyltransferase
MIAAIWAFLLGLAVGSFLNVCIHRLPQGESIIRPRSRCPRCKKPVAAYDNIPLLSFLFLKGRCRHCRAAISFLYPTVELVAGLTFVLVYLRFGFTASALKAGFLAAALIALIFIDLRDRLLPDAITFPAMAVGAAFSLWIPVGDGIALWLWSQLGGVPLPRWAFSLGDAVIAALVGGGILFALGEIWYRVRKMEGMGLGDVKMMVMVGLFLGAKLTILTLLLGSLSGSLVGGGYMLLTRKDPDYELPLGTFLGLAALVALFWGQPLIAAYVGLFR